MPATRDRRVRGVTPGSPARDSPRPRPAYSAAWRKRGRGPPNPPDVTKAPGAPGRGGRVAPAARRSPQPHHLPPTPIIRLLIASDSTDPSAPRPLCPLQAPRRLRPAHVTPRARACAWPRTGPGGRTRPARAGMAGAAGGRPMPNGDVSGGRTRAGGRG